jgi:hypothetical protein
VAAIEAFGRYRIPQFMARSRLLVIPGTSPKPRSAPLAYCEPHRHRAFRFADLDTADLFEALSRWYADTAAPVLAGLSEDRPGDVTTLAELKIAEWTWLTTALATPAANAQPAGAVW